MIKREDLNEFLQHAPLRQLQELCEVITREARVELVQKPTFQTMLVPVRDPLNDGVFLAGEVLVTSTIAKVNDSLGWSMVLDQNMELAEQLALLDASFAAGVRVAEIERLVGQGRQVRDSDNSGVNQMVRGTRVSFDLL